MARDAPRQLGRFEICLVAERREPREAETSARREQPELERQVAALRDQADLAGREIDPRREIELRVAVEDAEAVRPEQDRVGVADAAAECALLRLADAGADADDRAGADVERLVVRLLERCRGDARDDELPP